MYEHATSGLNLTLFRAYDPNTAKWLSRDTMGEGSDATLYSYVWNSSINLIDPLGLAGGAAGENQRNPGLMLAPTQEAAQEMANAVNSALAKTGEGNTSQATPLTPIDSSISNASKLTSDGNWTPVYNSHGSDTTSFEEPIPQSHYVIKTYLNDGQNKGLNTATISAPTNSIDHYIDYILFKLGLNPNLQHAQCISSGKGKQ
jgi:RHS repeat-associated protein